MFLVTGCSTSGVPLDLAPKHSAFITGHFARPEITESSGIAASRTQPGVYWTLNDSGGAPMVYAFDINGRDLGAWQLEGAENTDWEALDIGPCTEAQSSDCFYIGETGDNAEQRNRVSIYRAPEPWLGEREPGSIETIEAQRIDFSYEDGPHDVEGIYVLPSGGLGLISKGRTGKAQLFVLDELETHSQPLVARSSMVLFDSVDEATGSRVTGASLSADGRALAVLSYANLFIFRADPRTGLPLDQPPPTRCPLRPLALRQGEAVTWYPLDNGFAQVVTSEGPAGQIALLTCPRPSE
ncbi:MAG: hypothetical protein AAF385_15910 [Pseudomonadota bacterium]